MGIPCTSLTLPQSQRETIKIFVKGVILVGVQKFFRVDFGFSLCYNAPNDKGNVLSFYIEMGNFKKIGRKIGCILAKYSVYYICNKD